LCGRRRCRRQERSCSIRLSLVFVLFFASIPTSATALSTHRTHTAFLATFAPPATATFSPTPSSTITHIAFIVFVFSQAWIPARTYPSSDHLAAT
jgi:hypothetical protein